ncbi:hypothetical protein CLVI_31360 [Clostridium vincentii]|uniref:Uncharacterized protein n=1 Tax=Clostridium vincentii TaxID=52704 RepID=A0A2T0B855_9CLOT|nr:hypothetical protein CLVI_31360 [Clostridium vincentii]
MEKSKVYFTNMKTAANENLLQKLRRLIKTAGISEINFEKNMQPLRFILVNLVTWLFCTQILLK